MRVLVTSFPGVGHFHPVAPLALALTAAGHDVLVTTGSDLVGWVRRCGLPAAPAGLTQRAAVRRAKAYVPAGHAFGPLMFAQISPAPMLADLRVLTQRWLPHLIVHEEGEYAAPLLAALLDRPCVTHSWPAPARPVDDRELAMNALAGLWEQVAGQAARVTGDLYLDACPPPLQSGAVRSIPLVMTVRPEPFDGPGFSLPSRLHHLPRPAAYLTFGTVSEFARPDRLAAAADATAHEVATVLVTSGPNAPADITATRSNVHVERYLPQHQVLARSDVVISHGGAGSTVAALIAGLPQLVLPQGAPSQERSGQRLDAAGAGLTISPERQDKNCIRSHVRKLLQEPSFAQTARRIANELQNLPAPSHVARKILDLCR
jgi:UDP:flavonoid glycosyltransferase YjiC (YdhE family)